MKEHREKDLVSSAWNAELKKLELIQNGKNSSTLFFEYYLG